MLYFKCKCLLSIIMTLVPENWHQVSDWPTNINLIGPERYSELALQHSSITTIIITTQQNNYKTRHFIQIKK